MPFHHSDGSIFSEVELYEYDDSCDLNTLLKVRDCDRVIQLSINPGKDQETLDNALFKIDTIISHLSTLRGAVLKGYNKYIELRQEIDKRRAQKEAIEKAAKQVSSGTLYISNGTFQTQTGNNLILPPMTT